MLARRPPQNSVWGCSIGKRLLILCTAVCLVLEMTGCGGISRANANIAFMGDSITYYWWLPTTNLGVPGNTTLNMLERFPTEVPGHPYRAVVILGGTNDVRNRGIAIQTEVSRAIASIEAMAEEAESDNILVVLCTIPPIRNQNERVLPMNVAIEALAEQHHYKLVDYYTPMDGHPEYFKDGIHPSQDGYFVMQRALTKVLSLDY